LKVHSAISHFVSEMTQAGAVGVIVSIEG